MLLLPSFSVDLISVYPVKFFQAFFRFKERSVFKTAVALISHFVNFSENKFIIVLTELQFVSAGISGTVKMSNMMKIIFDVVKHNTLIRTRLKWRVFGIIMLVVFAGRQPACILRTKFCSKTRSLSGRRILSEKIWGYARQKRS